MIAGCSPSPCESLSSELLQSNSTDTNSSSIKINPHKSKEPYFLADPPAVLRQRSEFFEPQADEDNQLKGYLQTFERRHSDSNCLVDRSASYEKVNLADEIKKLSERLMILSSMNTELKDLNDNIASQQETLTKDEAVLVTQSGDEPKINPEPSPSLVNGNSKPIKAPKPKIIPREVPVVVKPAIKEKPEFLKNRSKPKMEEVFKKSICTNEDFVSRNQFHRSSTFTRASSVVHTTSSFTENVFGNKFDTIGSLSRINRGALFDRLQQLEDMPKLQPKLTSIRKISDNLDIDRTHRINSRSMDVPVEFSSPKTQFVSNAPWASNLSTRRTKFRVTQMSRDVPVGSPDKHRPIFLEESVTTTKDCLLHLLDKYNENDRRTAFSQHGRQSMSMNVTRSDDVEQRSMNSLNFFFQRHATMGNTVKQMQAHLESKRQS